jgi:sterol desaturase/sphingolipid hydroxylase (fatty acid hydroxylase superfamily)
MQFLSGKAEIVLLALAILFLLERVFPAARTKASLNRLARSYSLASLNFLVGLLLVLPLSQFAASHALGLRPVWWNMALDLVVLDLWIHAWHRLNHAVPLLWRFHFGEVVISSAGRDLVAWRSIRHSSGV